MKNVLAAASVICGFLASVYVSLVGEDLLLWPPLVLIFVVPMILAALGDDPE